MLNRKRLQEIKYTDPVEVLEIHMQCENARTIKRARMKRKVLHIEAEQDYYLRLKYYM